MKLKLDKKINTDPGLPLRIGLSGVLIYAGLSIITSPERWFEFIPQWINHFIDNSHFVLIYGILEIILGLLLLSGFFLSLVSILVFINFLLITAFWGINDATFRDFGLAMAALSLFILSLKSHPFKK